jgi:hypothetical protein
VEGNTVLALRMAYLDTLSCSIWWLRSSASSFDKSVVIAKRASLFILHNFHEPWISNT